ncbi:MAG: LacI family transcriptional regulator [Lentisphaerae bacterium]|nr:LacI family transcriptional regulator [Lentisphaerota bacterium]
MTLNEIARALNISKTAVSFCLNGRAKEFGLRPELEEQVKAFADEHGYKPNAAARKLRNKKSVPPIGIVFINEGSLSKFGSTFKRIFRYLQEVRREYIFMGSTISQLGNTMQTLNSMEVKDVLAIGRFREPDAETTDDPIEATGIKQWQKVKLMLQNGMHLYLANYAFPLPENHITENIVRVGFDRNDLQRNFLKRAIAENLAPVALTNWTRNEELLVPEFLESKDLIIPIEWNDQCQGGREVGEYILSLRKKRPVRTVFISNTISAISLISTLTDAGVRVPEDIAVAAFGDDPLAEAVRPKITTVGSPDDDKTLDLLKSICGELPPFPENTVIPYSFQERDSLKF